MAKVQEKGEFRNILRLKNSSRLEKVLCLITVISLLMVAFMAAALAFIGYLYNNNADLRHKCSVLPTDDNLFSPDTSLSNVCLTPGCVNSASALLSILNESVDPCGDFYEFACGGWLKKNTIADDKSSASIYDDEVYKLDLKLKTLIETKLDDKEPSFITMMKNVYNTCMDLETIEKTGSEPLQNVLRSLGGWPVVEGWKWRERKFDWVETLMSLRKLGYHHNILLNLYVTVDYKNNEINILKFDQPSLGMPDRTYLISGLNDTSTAAYYKQMVTVATLLGATKATAEKELLETLQFEMALANYSLPKEERRNFTKTYNKYSVKDLQELFPQIPWLKYINGLLMNEIYDNETLIVSSPEFMKTFASLITSTEKRVIANYLLWRVVKISLPLLSKKWREIAHEYNKVLTGKKREKPRWEVCLSSLWDNFRIALSSYYVRHHFKVETRNEVLKMVKYVHKEFLRILEEVDWMDEKTKAHAKAKANDIIFYIGYPDELLNNTALMEHYQNLTISNDSYFENILRLKKWSTDYNFYKLRKRNSRTDWKKFSNSATINAFYHFTDNSIELSAGILQSPFFSNDRPNYMNYASIGFTIGHEITHGFDDKGRQFDKNGNNINWWEDHTDKHFRKKVQCIIDQYNNYTAENGMKLNGVNTQGENIADNGALKETYLAYQSWVQDNHPEQLLPGLKYNQNQLFWISAAYEWCTKYRPENLKRLILTDPHSPDKFRIIGSMSNSEEFSKDFNCPINSPMNRNHKCKVW